MTGSPTTAPAVMPARTCAMIACWVLEPGASGISSPTAPMIAVSRVRSTVNVKRTSGTLTQPHRRAARMPSATSTDGAIDAA
jgi:hypothetical protein